MRLESPNLGPLWEGEPKTSGFRVSIPQPDELITWVQTTSALCGDTTLADIQKDNIHQSYLFLTGQSARFLPTERRWQLEINDLLFQRINVELTAGYSPDSGEWGDIIFYLEFSSLAETIGYHWLVPRQADQIAHRLSQAGLIIASRPDSDHCQVLLASGRSDTTVEISLGYLSPEDRQAATFEDPGAISDPIIVRPSDWSLDKATARDCLRLIQHSLSYLVDSLYQTIDQPSPNQVFELSVSTELE